LAFAREELARFSSGSSPWSEASAMTAEGSQAMMRHLMQVAMRDTVNRMHVIAAAKAGDEGAIEVLASLLIELKSRRVEMPTELLEYDMWQTLHRSHRRPARKKKNYVLRDLCIAMTVAAIVDRFPTIRPTGRSARNRSACQLVGEALNPSMNYSAVKAIWQRYGHVMPTIAGWAST
jgi:hypothetical protein